MSLTPLGVPSCRAASRHHLTRTGGTAAGSAATAPGSAAAASAGLSPCYSLSPTAPAMEPILTMYFERLSMSRMYQS